MKKIFPILLAAVFAFASCGDDEQDDTVPACIDQLAETLDVCKGGNADLTKWNFNGRDVYCFFYGDCTTDAIAEIYEEDCTLICTLFGLAGETTCEGIEWDGNATNRRLIYTF